MKNRGKALALGLTLAILIAPVSVAGPKKEPAKKVTRTESREYSGAAGAEAQGSQSTACINDSGCASFSVLKGEQYVSFELRDASGTPAPFMVSYHGSDSFYCGSSEPIWLNRASRVSIIVLAFSESCSGVGTAGSLAATFSNIR